jgi:HPr kinase/phosphorylase
MTTSNPRVPIHATCVLLGPAAAAFGAEGEAGVLLLGPSGAGKSDVAVRLIGLGARLVSDDQTMLFVENGRLFAESPPSLHGQMEIRGIGVVTLEAASPALIVLVVVLDPDARVERLPERASYRLPAPLTALLPPPVLTLRPFEASTPAKIAAAVAALTRGGFVAGAGTPK